MSDFADDFMDELIEAEVAEQERDRREDAARRRAEMQQVAREVLRQNRGSSVEQEPAKPTRPTHEPWSAERRAKVRATYCADADDVTAERFMDFCELRGLSPEARQVYLIDRRKRGEARPVWVYQTGIDGYRLIAARSGCYAGSDDIQFDHDPNYDGRIPSRATASVRRLLSNGQIGLFTASARWDEYGSDVYMWGKMPHTMLGKVAESLALRKAFPEELSGIYTAEEMDQSEAPASNQPVAQPAPKSSVPTRPATKLTAGSPANDEQFAELRRLTKVLAIPDADINRACRTLYGTIARELTFDNVLNLITRLQVAATSADPHALDWLSDAAEGKTGAPATPSAAPAPQAASPAAMQWNEQSEKLWLINIEKATTLTRLDAIAEQVTKQYGAMSPTVQQAWDAKRKTVAVATPETQRPGRAY